MADKSKLGIEFPLYSLKVEKNKIAEFAAAVAQKEDTDHIKAIYRDVDAAKNAGYENIPIPPTFPTSFVFWTGGGLLGTVNAVGADLSKLLHSEEDYEYFAPICAGDVITRKMKVVDMYDRGKKERKGWVCPSDRPGNGINQSKRRIGSQGAHNFYGKIGMTR